MHSQDGHSQADPAKAGHSQAGNLASKAQTKAQTKAQSELDNFLAQLDEIDRTTQHLKPPPNSAQTNPVPPNPTNPKAQVNSISNSAPPSPHYPLPPHLSPPPASTYPIPSLIEQLSQYAKEKLAARAERQRQQQARAALEASVNTWLERLDPYSDDGFWFEQFAAGYASRLEAAIAFLYPDTVASSMASAENESKRPNRGV